jgi:hypothetical protein
MKITSLPCPCPALAALAAPCPCPCPMSLNRQTPHFLRPETKRNGFFLGYGFQDLDGQTDRHCKMIVLTVPKTCEINEKKSKRRTDRYTRTMFVIIYRTSGCPWPSATLVHVLETFNFFILIFMYFLFLLLLYIYFYLDASLKFGKRRHTSFFFK